MSVYRLQLNFFLSKHLELNALVLLLLNAETFQEIIWKNRTCTFKFLNLIAFWGAECRCKCERPGKMHLPL